MPIANRVFFKFHSPLSIDVSSYDDLIMHLETTIRKEVEH